MQYEEKMRHLIGWQAKADYLASLFCQDENDRSLLRVETFDNRTFDDCGHMISSGEHGDWVSVGDFRKLAERFLLAMELISVMEENQDI